MRVKVEFEGNEEETAFVDFGKMLVGLENVLKQHFDEVLYDNDGFVCRNNRQEKPIEKQE